MQYIEEIERGLKLQGIDLVIEQIPLNISMMCGIDFHNAFIERETDDVLIIVETTVDGTEELRILNKMDVSCIAVVYINNPVNKTEDKVVNKSYQ